MLFSKWMINDLATAAILAVIAQSFVAAFPVPDSKQDDASVAFGATGTPKTLEPRASSADETSGLFRSQDQLTPGLVSGISQASRGNERRPLTPAAHSVRQAVSRLGNPGSGALPWSLNNLRANPGSSSSSVSTRIFPGRSRNTNAATAQPRQPVFGPRKPLRPPAIITSLAPDGLSPDPDQQQHQQQSSSYQGRINLTPPKLSVPSPLSPFQLSSILGPNPARATSDINPANAQLPGGQQSYIAGARSSATSGPLPSESPQSLRSLNQFQLPPPNLGPDLVSPSHSPGGSSLRSLPSPFAPSSDSSGH